MLKIRELGHRDLERYYSLMEIDFDSEELLSKAALHKGLLRGNVELLSVYEEESNMDVAYALVFCRGLYGYVLLKYFGVFPWYRGKGIGIEAMRLLNKRYADRQGILAEITDFDDPEPDHRRKLLKFFARFGYVDVKSDYTIGGADVHLMVKPIKGTWDISPVYHRILTDFYSRCMNPFAMDKMLAIKPVK